MTELMSIRQVAEYFGENGRPLSLSRAYALVSANRIKRVSGYPADEVKAIPRPGQGARTDLTPDVAFFASRDSRAEPTQTHTQVRLHRFRRDRTDTPPEVLGSGRFTVADGEPLDVSIRVGDEVYVPAGSWEPMRGEWICYARLAANDGSVTVAPQEDGP